MNQVNEMTAFYVEALREIDCHIRSTEDPIPYIIETLKRSMPEYQDEPMERIIELQKRAGMMKLAEHIIDIAQTLGHPISNVHLQKVMFFAIGFHVRDKGRIDILTRETYDHPFERWKYGPAVPFVWYHYQESGGLIKKAGRRHALYDEWTPAITKLLHMDERELVVISRDMESWMKYEKDLYDKRLVPAYSLNDIKRDFVIAR